MDGNVDWRQRRNSLEAIALDDLDGSELDELADACFWTDDVDASMTHRRAAYRRHADAGTHDAAGMSAWRLFYDHFLVGETAVANGWRERGRRHVLKPGSALGGWLALADADMAPAASDARAHADRALAVARAHDDPNLHAMALTAAGRAAVAEGDRIEGLARLDEAMVAVINDELAPLFTGWVFCNVVGTCYAIADLQRAVEWSDSAMRWCATLRDGHLYPGLCRVYHAEVTALRGDWESAEAATRQACADLERYDERYAADAHYLRGELARRQGRLDEAASAFARTRELGGEPLPGQALLDAALGRPDAALAALRSAEAGGPTMPLPRATRLRALIEIASAIGDAAIAAEAAAGIVALAAAEASDLLDAHALAAAALTSSDEPAQQIQRLRAAIAAFDAVETPFEAAELRLAVAAIADREGDTATAGHERELATAALRTLGVADDERPTRSLLSTREREVLRLVSDGCTNPEIAERLSLSRHTVNRHVSNIMTKLGVNTRAAASARAVAEELL